MSKIVENIRSMWDWPLRSEFAQARGQIDSLKRASEAGSILCGIGSAGVIYAFELSAAPSAVLATASVLAGYYAGSATWRFARGLPLADNSPD